MAKINFYLRDPKAENKKTALIMFFASHGKRYKIATRHSLDPKHWDPDKQRAKGYAGSSDLNGDLLTLSKLAADKFKEFTDKQQIPSADQFRLSLKPQENVSDYIIPRYQQYIESSASTRGHLANKKYRTIQRHLESFELRKRKKLRFSDININFYNQFVDYSINQLQHTNNTIGKHIAMFKAFMNWAYDMDYHSNTEFRKFKILSEETDIIYLTESELMKLYEFVFKPGSTFDRVRDVFCFGCFTGQRFSDIANLKNDDIIEESWRVRTMKTKDPIIVPINRYAKTILSKYANDSKSLPVISNQKTNLYLKQLCAVVGIDSPVTNIKYRGSERIEDSLPKHEFITSHTARRTFVTLSLEKGMRPETVMAITGHKDYKTFKKYIKITSKVKEIEMNQVWT